MLQCAILWDSSRTEKTEIRFCISTSFFLFTHGWWWLFWHLATVRPLQAVWWTTQRSLRQNFPRSQVVKWFLNLSDGNLLFQLKVKHHEIKKSFGLSPEGALPPWQQPTATLWYFFKLAPWSSYDRCCVWNVPHMMALHCKGSTSRSPL